LTVVSKLKAPAIVTPSGAAGAVDQPKCWRAIEDASNVADGYLRPRHTLPLSAAPPLLIKLVAAIARHELHLGGDRQPTDQVRRDRDDAIAMLKDVAKGQADLGIAASGAEPEEDDGGVLFGTGADRITEANYDEYRGPAW